MPRLLTSALFFLLVTASQAAELTGRLVSIADGDAVTLLTADNQEIKIRLAEIDAPESGQPYGKKSKPVIAR